MLQTSGVGTLIRRARTLVRAMLDISANGQIRRLLTGWTLGIAGDALFLVIALVVAFDDGGALAVGVMGFVRMLPSTVVTLAVPLGRFRRLERVPVWVNVLRALTALATLVLLMVEGPSIGVYLAAAVIASVGALVRPTHLAILPAIARTPAELVSTNAASSVAEALGLLLGPALAGVLLVVSPAAGAAAAILLFVAATLASATVHLAEAARPGEARRERGAPLADGMRTLRSRTGAALVVLGFSVQTFVRGLLTTLTVVASFELLGLGDAGVGLLAAAMGAGGIAGAVAGFGLSGWARMATVFVASMLGWGIPIIALGLAPNVPVALVGMAVIGVSNATLDITGYTLLQRSIPSPSRPAVMAVLEATTGIGVAGGSIVAPFLGERLGIEMALVVTGAILPLLGVLTWRRLRRIDDDQVVPEPELRLLHESRLFGLLPLDALERLAAEMTPVAFSAGEVLMAEGEPGDRYIVLVDGRVSVDRRGSRLAVLGPGEGVGEIALLRSVPRVATVTALDPVEGRAIGRDEFLSVILGHDRSTAEAGAVVVARLAQNAEPPAAGPGAP
jgi:hypothetical protein